MPMPVYLKLTGKNQGPIEGSVTIKGREKTIEVQALDHDIAIPKSPQTGLPTGKRVHGAMTITKQVDKSSPKIMQALTTGEQMSDVELDFYRISPTGTEEKYYTVKLQNAIVVGSRAWIPNCLDGTKSSFGHMEDVSFSYEKIIWTWLPDGIEAEDSWNAPKG